MEKKIYTFRIEYMYGFVFGVTIFYIVMFFIWLGLNQMTLEIKHMPVTDEEYTFCKLPRSEFIGYI